MTPHVPPHAGSTSLARARHGATRDSACRTPASGWHRRRSARVPSRTQIQVQLGTTVYAARLADVAETGATLTASAVPLQVGMTIACVLPQGTALAEVRSLRPGHIGVAWTEVDASAERWLRHAAQHRVLSVL